jgi:hypothetical protein
VKDEAISFYSQYDDAVLGLGTRTFGTIDRVFSDAGGYVGFREVATRDPSQYAKLKQVPYNKAWVKLGNSGDHVGPMHQTFARQVIAPIAMHQAPNLEPPTQANPLRGVPSNRVSLQTTQPVTP